MDHINGSDDENFLRMFSNLDLDHDGLLDYNEFLQAAINHQKMLNKDNIWEIFKMFDINGDGMITYEELQYVFKENLSADPSAQFLKEIMSDIDKNNDNQISFEEFSDGLTSLLWDIKRDADEEGEAAEKVSQKSTEFAI